MPRRPKYREEDFPCPGTVFAAKLPDGRFTVGRVLRRKFEGGAQAALIAASPWIGRELPSLHDPQIRSVLTLNHHAWKGRSEVIWVWDLMPPSFIIVGQIAVSDEDRSASSNSYGAWVSLPHQTLTQWRWDHDRDALLAEEAVEAHEVALNRAKKAQARARLLESLTLDSLLGYSWLTAWHLDRPDLPIAESKKVLSDLVDALRSAPKLTKAMARKFLKEAVLEFNRLDASEQFIDTIERENLYEAFEYVMCAARYPELTDCVDDWREW